MKSLEELKIEAKELGLSFSPNISAEKLSERIEAFYQSQEDGAARILMNQVKKAEEKQDKEGIEESVKTYMQKLAKQQEEKVRKTRIITITDNDQRENNKTTTVVVNCGNEYFELGTRILPLNEPIEVEQGFIDVLNEIKIPMHIDDGKGLSKTRIRNRYSVHYEVELEEKAKNSTTTE